MKYDGLHNEMISIDIDGETWMIPKGFTLAAAITWAKGINYRKTRFGDVRGPVCNMGVCFDCSVFLEGSGNIRACMTEAKDGMRIQLAPALGDKSNSEANKKRKNQSTDIENSQQHVNYDVAIIGSGPAGMAAVAELSGKGLRVALIDEQENLGGQIYRHATLPSKESPSNPLVIQASRLDDIDVYSGNAVWAVVPVDKAKQMNRESGTLNRYGVYIENRSTVYASSIIIASGAYDRLLPFKGWTKPGVMSAGGLQIFAKTQSFVPGASILLAGNHPFLLIVAKQILDKGGSVKGIAFSQSFPGITELLPMGINGLKRWKKSKELLNALQAVRKAGVPIWLNRVPVEAEGLERVDRVHLAQLDKHDEPVDHQHPIDCDTVGLCYGFSASSELPRQIGCSMEFDALGGGWLVKVDEDMQSSMDHLYVAGEITGVGGAELSEIEGRLAALTILQKLSPVSFDKNRWNHFKKERSSWLSFAKMLSKITNITFDSLQVLEKHPDTLVCRCEEVTYAQIQETMNEHSHLSSMNAIKLMTRCGMGLCQGRYCERTLMEITKKNVGTPNCNDSFSSRFPVKPVIINEMKEL